MLEDPVELIINYIFSCIVVEKLMHIVGVPLIWCPNWDGKLIGKVLLVKLMVRRFVQHNQVESLRKIFEAD